jgi:hypothetical protein
MSERLTIYHYDRWYCFSHVSQIEPEIVAVAQKVYLLPLDSTILEPPEGEGLVAVFDPDLFRWHLMDDHRGEQWFTYRGDPIAIHRPGDPTQFGLQSHWP